MSKIVFRGKPMVNESKSVEERAKPKKGLLARLKSKIFGNIDTITIGYQEETIKVKDIVGIVFGPHTVSFLQYFKLQFMNEEIEPLKFDQWRYLGILTRNRSYDFIMDNKRDSFDLIISISESQRRHINTLMEQRIQVIREECPRKERKAVIEKEQQKFRIPLRILKTNLNRKLLNFEMKRRKIECMAKDKGYTLCQFFIIGIYNTVCQWPETDKNVKLINDKVQTLRKIQTIIRNSPKLKVLLDYIDLSIIKRLQRIINADKLDQISRMSVKSRNEALNKFFNDARRGSGFGLQKRPT